MAIASAGNDFRLGANEAPPAIMSVFLGETLTDVLDGLAGAGAGELKQRIKEINLELANKVDGRFAGYATIQRPHRPSCDNNFKAGVARGFGMTVGATLVLGVAIWILTMLVDLPVVGEYFSEARQYITEYAERTNYEDEFAEQIRLLQEIEQSNRQRIDTDPEGE